jgi:hypothetical protein
MNLEAMIRGLWILPSDRKDDLCSKVIFANNFVEEAKTIKTIKNTTQLLIN